MNALDVEKYHVGDMVWIDGVDVNNNESIYYECEIKAIVDGSLIVDPIEDSTFEPQNRAVVMFYQIDEIGLIT
jgi:hypothetical protein